MLRFWREALVTCCTLLCIVETVAPFIFRDCVRTKCSVWYQPKCEQKDFSDWDPSHFVCYTGRNQFSLESLKYAWTDTTFAVSAPETADFTIIKGHNYTVIKDAFETSLFDFFWSSVDTLLLHNSSSVGVPTFQPQCVGVKYNGKTGLHAKMCITERVHLRHPLLLVSGTVLFFLAPNLCQNIALQYSTGTALGVVASLLILIYIISRMVPGKKAGAFAFLAFGWSTVAYMLSMVWGSLLDTMVNHWQSVLAYVVVSGLISFAYCYWRGPVTSPRSLTIMQWTIQLVAVTMLYFSFQCELLALPTIALVLSVYNCPKFVIDWLRFKKYLWFPPKRRLLSLQEYKKQGEVETAKALEELREFCKKGDNSWDKVARLRHPKRFMKFLRGEHHVSSSNILEYSRSYSSASDLSGQELSFVNSLPSYRSASSNIDSSSSEDDSS